MVEIFAFDVDLAVADLARQAVAVVERSGTSLKLTPDAAQLVDELAGLTYRLIGIVDLAESLDQFRSKFCSAVRSEETVAIRILVKIV